MPFSCFVLFEQAFCARDQAEFKGEALAIYGAGAMSAVGALS